MGYGYPRRWKFIDWQAVDAAAAKALDFLGSPLPLDRPVAELTARREIDRRHRPRAGRQRRAARPRRADRQPARGRRRAPVRASSQRLRAARRQHHLRHPPPRRGVPHRRCGDRAARRPHGRRLPAADDSRPEQLVTDIVGTAPATRIVAPAAPTRHAGARGRRTSRSAMPGRSPSASAVGEIVGLAGLRGQGHEAVGRAIAGVLPARRAARSRSAASRSAHPLAGRRDRAPASASPPASAPRRRSPARCRSRRTSSSTRSISARRASGLRSRRARARGGRRDPAPLRRSPARSRARHRHALRRQPAEGRARPLGRPALPRCSSSRTRRSASMSAPRPQIYRMMQEDAAAGTAAIVVSSDLDELVQICDRVLAFSRGRIVAELPRDELSVEALTARGRRHRRAPPSAAARPRNERRPRHRREGRRRPRPAAGRAAAAAARFRAIVLHVLSVARPARLRHPARHRLLDPAAADLHRHRRPSAPSSATTRPSRCWRWPR